MESVTAQVSPETGVPLRSSMKATGVAVASKVASGVTARVGAKLPEVFLISVTVAPLATAVKLAARLLSARIAAASAAAISSSVSTSTVSTTSPTRTLTDALVVSGLIDQTSSARGVPLRLMLKAGTAAADGTLKVNVPAAPTTALKAKLPAVRLTISSRSPSTMAVKSARAPLALIAAAKAVASAAGAAAGWSSDWPLTVNVQVSPLTSGPPKATRVVLADDASVLAKLPMVMRLPAGLTITTCAPSALAA